MKKILLFIALFTITIMASNAQARIGFTSSDIKKEFANPKYNLITGYTDDNIYYITITNQRALVIYYFNTYQICDLVIIVPKTQGDLNFYVETYNKQYVINSNNTWTAYLSDGILHVKLTYLEDGGYVFTWKP